MRLPFSPFPNQIPPLIIYLADTSLIWTIWTINEPANYIIAASLPTLRPIFVRIFPSSFFILSNRNTKRSTRRSTNPIAVRKTLQSPSSSATLSPLEGGRGGSGRQHFRWTTVTGTSTGEHGSGCEECWVDVETGQPGGGYSRGSSSSNIHHHSNNNNNYATDINTSNETVNEREHHLAVMRAPGFDKGGQDEVVLETMIHVSAAKKGFF